MARRRTPSGGPWAHRLAMLDPVRVGGALAVMILALVAIVVALLVTRDDGAELVTSTPTTDSSTALAPTTSVVEATTTSTTIASTTTPRTSPTTSPTTAATTPIVAPTTLAARSGLRGAVIVLDPGHNGANGSNSTAINRQVDAGGFTKACNTTGTAAGDYSEARFNWELAGVVAAALRDRGAQVELTRPDNDGWGPCVDQRGRAAVERGADVLVSLHADGAAAGRRGFHLISASPRSGYVSDSAAASSALLAAAIRDQLVVAGLDPSNYIGTDGLDVRGDLGTLNLAGSVPAVMLECGNMRDAQDLGILRSADGQGRIATAITEALDRYLSR